MTNKKTSSRKIALSTVPLFTGPPPVTGVYPTGVYATGVYPTGNISNSITTKWHPSY